ncbi:MAG: diacylglycerol/lipid kinase family protein [Anaerolineales bacterium]
MDRKKVFIVLNPVAGTTDPDDVRVMFGECGDEGGLECEVYETQEDDDVTAIVREALGNHFDLVVVAGGDGTVSSVASALVNTEIPLAILPAGTGNVFAQELGVPEDLEEAMSLLLGEHKVRCVDVMQTDERYCLLNVGVGMSASMMEDTERDQKRSLGFFAYILAGVKKALGYQPHRFNITIDGKRQKVHASEVMVVNSPALGTSTIRLQDGIRLDDGQMEVCFLQTKSVLDYAKIGTSLLLAREKQSPHIHCIKVDEELTIEADEEVGVQGDGDLLGTTPVTVRLVPQALQVIVPRDSEK